MYKCEICGAVFDEPYIREYSEPRPDGFWEHIKQVLCPVCFEPHFKKLEDDDERP